MRVSEVDEAVDMKSTGHLLHIAANLQPVWALKQLDECQDL
jgi:hypothetical protein